jgi:hypothetical protein
LLLLITAFSILSPEISATGQLVEHRSTEFDHRYRGSWSDIGDYHRGDRLVRWLSGGAGVIFVAILLDAIGQKQRRYPADE